MTDSGGQIGDAAARMAALLRNPAGPIESVQVFRYAGWHIQAGDDGNIVGVQPDDEGGWIDLRIDRAGPALLAWLLDAAWLDDYADDAQDGWELSGETCERVFQYLIRFGGPLIEMPHNLRGPGGLAGVEYLIARLSRLRVGVQVALPCMQASSARHGTS